MSRTTLGFLLGFLGVVAFGGSFPMGKLAVAWFDPGFVTFWRAGLASLIAMAVLVALAKPIPPRKHWRGIAIAAVCVVWVFPGLTVYALKLVEASHAGVIAGILPLGTAIAAAIILKERQSHAFWGVSVIGMLAVVGFSMREGAGVISAGDALVLVAVAVVCAGYVFQAQVARELPGWEVISWVLVATLPFNLIGMMLTWPGVAAFRDAPPSALAGLAYVAIISQYLGFFAWNAGLAMGGIARVGQVQLLQTFITLIFAALVVGETVEPLVWGSAVIVVALVFAAKRVAR